MMTTSEIVKIVADAFDANDTQTILANVADNIEWLLLGGPAIYGREGMRKFFTDNPNTKILSATRENFIVDENKVVVNGQVSCLTGSGSTCQMFYCDIYEVAGDKVAKITSYLIDRK